MIINVDEYLSSIGVQLEGGSLMHYGTKRHSGRYPWGSGENPSNKDFLGVVAQLKKDGLSEADIAKGMGMTTTQLRAAKSIAKNAQKQADIGQAQRLKDHGYSNVEIGKRMGINESSVRALLAPGVQDKLDVLQTTAGMLKNQVADKEYVDIGTGVETHLGITRTKLDTAVAVLKEQGYEVHTVQVDQLGTTNKTAIKVLAPPGTTYRDIAMATEKIRQIQEFSEDGGRTYLGIKPPLNVDSKRVAVLYGDEGGKDADGVIYVRPGVEDISIGNARYAQVRVAVDGSHYLKGMAIYKDDLPDGVDLMFNTNKSDTGNKLDAMKQLKDDPDNPFGATIRQRIDPKTGKVTSAMNIVGMKEGSGEEGSWDTWSRNLPSQFLSKQSPALAKSQLEMTYEKKRRDLDEILELTNPAVRKKLLDSYADGADSSAVHLKAAALPRQSTHVILPVNSMKDNEIYAPNFKNGEVVSLVRFPHGGTFEIPELVVNNNHAPAKKLLGRAVDAVGINSRVAERLSGADFDGDTVLVIPNNSGRVKSTPALERLKGFDAKREYPEYEGMKVMDARTKAFEMGDVSNLITDMTIKAAPADEIARAVRHSMVVIDAEKHRLDYKRSAIDHGIPALKEKYQGKKNAGASTLVSQATSPANIRARKLRAAKDGGPIDPKTGKKVYVETGESWLDSKGRIVYKKEPGATKLGVAEDAFDLSSGTKMESIYATHSNRLKALADEARKASYHTKPTPYSPSAKKAFHEEVKTLDAKLSLAYRNRPKERQAQVIANAIVRTKRHADPNMSKEELKRVKSQALSEARRRTGAEKNAIVIDSNEWRAIQAGAISNHKLTEILNNADLDVVKTLATPKRKVLMTSTATRRAEAMARQGYTQAEIAEAIGVSLTTLKRGLNGEE